MYNPKKKLQSTGRLMTFFFILVLTSVGAVEKKGRNAGSVYETKEVNELRDLMKRVVVPNETVAAAFRYEKTTNNKNLGGIIVRNDVVASGDEPKSSVTQNRNGMSEYRAKKGDTLQKIAAQFGISVETIRWANSKITGNLKQGERIAILPVSGFIYIIKEEDTLESLALEYRIPSEEIEKYNPDHENLFSKKGSRILLPHAKPKS